MKPKLEMDEDAKAKLDAFNAEQADWYGKCRKCGAELKGTIAVLKSHRCPDGG